MKSSKQNNDFLVESFLSDNCPPMGIYETLYAFRDTFGSFMGTEGTHPGRKVSLLPRRWKNSVGQNFLIVSKLHGKIDFIPRLGGTQNCEKQSLTTTTQDMAHQ